MRSKTDPASEKNHYEFPSTFNPPLTDTELAELNCTKKELEKCTALIKAKETELKHAENQQKHSQGTLNYLNSKLQELDKKILDYQTQGLAIENSTEYVKIHQIMHQIKGQTHEVEVEQPTGRMVEKDTRTLETRHVKFQATKTVDDPTKPIYKTEMVNYTLPKKITVPETEKVKITEKVPPGHLLEYRIALPLGYPVQVHINNARGWSIKPRTESKNHGYKVTILYEKRDGFTCDIDVSALKKYTTEGKSKLEELRSLRIAVDAQRSKLSIQRDNQQAHINKRQGDINALKTCLTKLAEQVQLLRAEHQALQNYLNKNQAYFDSLQTSNKLVTPEPTATVANNRHVTFKLASSPTTSTLATGLKPG